MELRPDIARRIVERIGASVDRAVSVSDTQGFVLASTNPTHLHTYLASKPHLAGEVAGFNPDRGEQRGLLSLIYADQVVGMLVLEGIPASDHQTAGLAKTLAELIIHQMLVIEELPRQAQFRNTFVRHLVEGRLKDSDPLVEQEAALLGINLHLPRVVAVMDVELFHSSSLNPTDAAPSLPAVARALWIEQSQLHLIEQARRRIANHVDDVYAFISEHQLVLLAVGDQPLETSHHRVALRVRSFLHALGSEHHVYSAGVGPYYPAWTGLHRSWIDAAFALETGARLHGSGGAYCWDDLGLADFIWHPDRATTAEHGRQLLAGLGDDEDLLATLQVFLAANLSPSAAAATLHIHRHTLTYRLKKIQHLTGLDPCTFVHAVQLHAALLLRTINGSDS